VRRERAPVDAHPDRTPDLRAALEALGAVPIDYAGTVHDRRGTPVMKVLTPATVDALIVAVDRVREIVDSRQCPPGAGPCTPCSRLSQAWTCWRAGVPFYPEVPAADDPETIVLPDPERESLLPRALMTALQRFATTRSIQDVSESVRETCDTEADRLDSELSMVRYVIWAIPSIGFIGTVRHIGDALLQAHKAVTGDITGVTSDLGIAFNATFVALLLTIILMFFLHQLQQAQEQLVHDTDQWIDQHLIRHMQVR